MKLIDSMKTYYSLFGAHGVIMRARSCFSEQPLRVLVEVPGVRSPICIRLGTTDVATLGQVFVKGGYDWDFAVSPSVIIDAGANIGLASVFFANKYPDAHIIAIEPEASNFEMLKQNTLLYPNIRVLHAALWNERKEVCLINQSAGKDAFQTRERESGEPGNAPGYVHGMTMDEVFAAQGITYVDILKIDIEGAEKEVFANPSSWIEKVGIVMVELHDYIKIGCSRNVYKATAEFEGLAQHGETIVLARLKYLHGTVDGSDIKREQMKNTKQIKEPGKLHIVKTSDAVILGKSLRPT